MVGEGGWLVMEGGRGARPQAVVVRGGGNGVMEEIRVGENEAAGRAGLRLHVFYLSCFILLSQLFSFYNRFYFVHYNIIK